LSEEQVALLLDRAAKTPDYRLTVSLEDQTVKDEQGFHATFEIDPFRKYCLIEGLDDIGLTLRHASELDAFESRHNRDFWLAPRV
jgi:3-isopropylmalate/(R)-2-methylmalate dehydratase small subunit